MISTTISEHTLNDRWGVAQHRCGTTLNQFLLRRLDPGESGGYWDDGITPDVVNFIVEKCKCAQCDAPISAPLAPCACDHANENWDRAYLAAAYPSHGLSEEVKRLYTRHKGRIGQARRAEMVKANGGKITLQDKVSLFTAQGGLCFYCGESLVDCDGRNRYHCDHFVSLANGGRNDLENSVLACKRCNMLKNSRDGHHFLGRVRKLQLVNDPSGLAQMRKALAVWRKSRGLRAFSTLGGE